MEPRGLYKLPFNCYLSIFDESEQTAQLLNEGSWYEKSTILLPIKKLPLGISNFPKGWYCHSKEEVALSIASQVFVDVENHDGYVLAEDLIQDRKIIRKNFSDTGVIEGELFLMPDMRKVWLSTFSIKRLIPCSSNHPQ